MKKDNKYAEKYLMDLMWVLILRPHTSESNILKEARNVDKGK
jgi:hypothetical protein